MIRFLLFVFLGWQVWQNNRDAASPSQAEIKRHFDRSVDWVTSNYSNIENIQNPILWWMIKQAGLNSNDERLKIIFSKYKKEHLDKKPANLSIQQE